MDDKEYTNSLAESIRKNKLLSFFLVLTLTVTCFSSFFSYRATKEQKIVLVPVGYNEKIELEEGKVNDSYLLVMSRYVIDQALNYHKFNVKRQYQTILAMMSPRAYEKYEPVFHAFGEDAQIGDVVSTFLIDKFEHDISRKIVKITGNKMLIYDGQEVETKRATYAIKYSINSGRFTLEELGEWKEVENAQ